ncbi:hypothetical protein SFR_1541 [Streptomyces sp. FR-008]|nr:hypothetical protein SFR_1541 [Streptomyces sp. FR-008]
MELLRLRTGDGSDDAALLREGAHKGSWRVGRFRSQRGVWIPKLSMALFAG